MRSSPSKISLYRSILITVLLTDKCSSLALSADAASRLLDLCARRKIKESATILLGVHDALSAKIFSDAGADALFLRYVFAVTSYMHSGYLPPIINMQYI
jgi:hypothetical protein